MCVCVCADGEVCLRCHIVAFAVTPAGNFNSTISAGDSTPSLGLGDPRSDSSKKEQVPSCSQSKQRSTFASIFFVTWSPNE